jgi:acetyl esterase/lipase
MRFKYNIAYACASRRALMADDFEILVEYDAVYAHVSRPLRWNIFRSAAASATAPAVLLYHGGGLRVGKKAK